jgi:energy-coupling factor transport system permease protein
MESRCYHGGEGRTRLKQLQLARRDLLAFLFGAALIAAIFILRSLGF